MADTETVGGIEWSYTIFGDKAALSSCCISKSTTGAIIIPSTLGDCPVTSIGPSAFSRCSGLTSVTIPDSVTYIGPSAFYGCSGLTSVTIPDSVTSIWSSAFYGCSTLTDVTIPDGVTSIGNYVFSGCGGLTSVTIPDSVTSIEQYAFSGCSGLTSVTIPDSVTSIGGSAFENCSGLTNLTIPDSVTSIGAEAFYGCSGLTSVAIGHGVTSIGNCAFSSCNRLASITVETSNPNYSSVNGLLLSKDGNTLVQGINGDVTIPDTVISIGQYAFSGCSGLTSITIPDSVTYIGQYAFSGCSGLTSITIPDSVTYIGESPFSGCPNVCEATLPGRQCGVPLGNVTNLIISSGTTSIGQSAFSGRNGLTSVTIPDSVRSIGDYAFSGCSGLMGVTIPDSVTSIGRYAFSGCSGLTSITIPDNVTSISDYAFSGCSGLASVTIPNSVTNIGQEAFYGCSWLRSVSIPQCVCSSRVCLVFGSAYESITDIPITNIEISAGVTNIASGVFDYCHNLATITIPDSVTSISDYAFSGCSRLANLTIPNSVTSISAYAFSSCSGLTSITIPNSVTSIGDYAFAGCSTLTDVTIPDSVTSIGNDAFYGCGNLESVVIPDSVTNVGFGAFSDCGRLTSVTIPQCVCASELSSVFYPVHESITNVEISAGVTNIGSRAFEGCASLVSVVVPEGVTNIGSGAFSSCSGLTSITMPNSVTSIGDVAFHYCSGLTTITIPDSVTSIGYSAFDGCSGLTSVSIGNGITSIEDGTFYNCSKLASVTIPAGVTNIGYSAFSNCRNLSAVVFRGDEPEAHFNSFGSVNQDCTGYVSRFSSGWWVPSTWNGIELEYLEYFLSFDANGGDGGTSGWVEYQSAIMPPTVARVGHTFLGWLPDVPATMPANNVTCAAQWVPNKYTIAFDANGGEGGMAMTLEYDTVIVAPVVTRTGYTFTGWHPDVAAAVPASNVSYTAQWEINRYAVTFNANGGICETLEASIEHGAVVGELPMPMRENALFLGWFTAAEGGDKVDCATMVTGDMRLFAHWLTLEDALDVRGVVALATPVDKPWMPVLDAFAKEGDSTVRSGTIGDRETTWLSATVKGTGTMSFWCKVSCEHDEDDTFMWDRLMVYTNGVEIVEWRMDGAMDWMQRTVSFDGGVNIVKWVYHKDRIGADGEDCAWLDDVSWMQDVSVSFNAGGATQGSAPDAVVAYSGESIALPGLGTLSWPRHSFLGWDDGTTLCSAGDAYLVTSGAVFTARWAANTLSAPVIAAPTTYEADSCTVTITADAGVSIYYTLDGSTPSAAATLYSAPFAVEGNATVRAIAVRSDYYDSEVSSAVVTRLAWTFGECLNCPERTFTTGGSARWTRAKGVSADGYALRSGDIGNSQTSRLETVVSGAGTISFSCRVEGEIVKKIVYDGLAFCIDGVQQGGLMGNTAWTTNTFDVSGGGAHTLSWLYVKDEDGDGGGEDCAWLDEVTWTPRVAAEPIPAVAADAVPEAVTNAIEAAGFADEEAIKAALGGEGAAERYAAFKAWAGSVKAAGSGSMGTSSPTIAGEAAVVANTNAAAAWLLGAERLFENAPKVEFGEVAVRRVEDNAPYQGGGDGGGLGTSRPAMSVSVVVKDGEDAVKCAAEKVKEMFEATGDLGDWAGRRVEDNAPYQNELPIAVTVEEPLAGDSAETMRFTVTPGDGTTPRAFLRIRK